MYRNVCFAILAIALSAAAFFSVGAVTATESPVNVEETSQQVAVQQETAVLTITGVSSGGKEVAFDLSVSALQALGTETIATSTIWTNGVNTFEGVPLNRLIGELEISGDRILATSINDYAVEIPLDETLSDDALLAYKMNGAPMSRRGKGPLWIVYPFDQSPKFRTETIYARSIWQLNRIHVIQ